MKKEKYTPNGYVEGLTSLAELKLLTESLSVNKKKNISKYNTNVLGKELLYLPEISVALFTLKSGASMSRHVHDQKEWLLVIKGILKYTYDDEEFYLNCGEVYYTEPNRPHSCECIEDVDVIAITMPCEEGYPHG